MRRLRPDQMAAIRQAYRRWHQFVAPCGISFAEIYNPCLPEQVDEGPLLCLTCGLRQRLALEAAR